MLACDIPKDLLDKWGSTLVDRGVLEVLNEEGLVGPAPGRSQPATGREGAAVSDQGLPNDPGIEVAGQKEDRSGHILTVGVTAGRNPRRDQPLVLGGQLVETTLVRAGLVDRDRVDQDAVAGEVNGQALGEAVDSPFE